MKLHVLGGKKGLALWTHTAALCQRTILRTVYEQRQSQKRPHFPCIPSSTSNEWWQSNSVLSKSSWSPVGPFPSQCAFICSGCSVVSARAGYMSDVSGAILFQDRLQSHTCLQANLLPMRRQMTQVRTQKYLTPPCQEISQH